MASSLYYYVVRGFLQMFASIFGVICNSISIVVLTRPVMRTSFNILLLGLAFADNIYLITRVILHGYVACLQFFDASYNYDNYYLPHLYPTTIFFNRIGQTASTYFTMAITLERFVVVCWPLHRIRLCTLRSATYVSAFISVFSLLYSVPVYFEQYPEPYLADDNSTTIYRKEFTNFGDSLVYQILYLKWGFVVFNYGIPFLVLIVFNTAIFMKVKAAGRFRQSMTQSENAEISIAKMLLCVVLVFGISNLPSAFYFFFAYGHPTRYIKVFWFGFLASSINSAVNFIIYCLMSRQFKTTLYGLCRISNWTSFNRNVRTPVIHVSKPI